jgi:hypothetical protein
MGEIEYKYIVKSSEVLSELEERINLLKTVVIIESEPKNMTMLVSKSLVGTEISPMDENKQIINIRISGDGVTVKDILYDRKWLQFTLNNFPFMIHYKS